jgi:hypothetical protein
MHMSGTCRIGIRSKLKSPSRRSQDQGFVCIGHGLEIDLQTPAAGNQI